MTVRDKWAVARMLEEIAKYLELSETNPFRSRAFEKAARAIAALDRDLAPLIASGELYATPGIGKAIGAIVSEFVTTGRAQYLEELRAQYPPGIFDLVRVPGLGIRKIGQIYEELGVATLGDLEAAARANKLAALRGFGAKTQARILQGIETARSRSSKFLLPVGLEIGEMLREQLAAIDAIADAEITGSVRRRLEVNRNVNLAVAGRDPERALAAIRRRGLADRLKEAGPSTLRGFVRDDVAVLFHIAKPEDFGATMLMTTGSEAFTTAFAKKIAAGGFTLKEGRLFRNGRHAPVRTEHDLFEKTGIPFVDPELREDAAQLSRRKRAKLVHPSDLRGTFHIHTTFSDGRNSVLEMLGAARERGYEYAGISDHSPLAFYARGLDENALLAQHREIAEAEPAVAPMRVFRGTEADILQDGTIDYGPQILGRFHFVIASVHSRFGMPKDEMTERILRALDDPHVTFLGHLTGRLLLSRDGYTIDYDRVFDRAAERGVMIEINGNPNRLELDWRYIRRAIDRGVVLSIHPDAHSVREYNAVISGTWVARKAGLTAKQIFNARPVEQVAEFLAQRKARATKGTAR